MRRRVLPALMGVTALFMLSGCFKMDTEIEVHSDDTVTGTMIVAMDKKVMEQFGDATEQEDPFEGELPKGAKVSDYDDGKYVGQKLTFDGITLDELMATTEEGMGGEGEDAWKITHEGDTYTFDGALDMTFDEGEEMMGTMMKDAEMRVSITFPGKVTDTNGEADGNTVTWHPEVGKANKMHAEAVEGGFPLLPTLVSVALIGALAAAGFVAFKRRTADNPPVTPGPEYNDMTLEN